DHAGARLVLGPRRPRRDPPPADHHRKVFLGRRAGGANHRRMFEDECLGEARGCEANEAQKERSWASPALHFFRSLKFRIAALRLSKRLSFFIAVMSPDLAVNS